MMAAVLAEALVPVGTLRRAGGFGNATPPSKLRCWRWNWHFSSRAGGGERSCAPLRRGLHPAHMLSLAFPPQQEFVYRVLCAGMLLGSQVSCAKLLDAMPFFKG